MGVLTRVGRGHFVFLTKRNYLPEVVPDIKSLYNKLKKKFPFLNICIWSTSLLNAFMNHQPGRYYVLIEVEKDATESVFYYLKEGKYSVFIEPERDVIEKYSAGVKETYIVKALVTEAPIVHVQGVKTVTLEKMLVDIFCDNVTFSAQQGSEMRTIFNEAFSRYAVNEGRLLRYAGRRNKKTELVKYLNSISNLRQ